MSEKRLTPSTDEPSRAPPTASEAFDALADSRRRRICRLLLEHRSALALSDVADEVAAAEHDGRFADIPEIAVARTYTSLYHTEIPRLTDAGLLEYDQELDAVAPTRHLESVAPLLDRAEEYEEAASERRRER